MFQSNCFLVHRDLVFAGVDNKLSNETSLRRYESIWDIVPTVNLIAFSGATPASWGANPR